MLVGSNMENEWRGAAVAWGRRWGGCHGNQHPGGGKAVLVSDLRTEKSG